MKTTKKLTNDQVFNLYLNEFKAWASQRENSDDGMVYALNNGYDLHAVQCWISSGASEYNHPCKIGYRAEKREINQICENAHIYVCPDCNHHAFLDEDRGEEIQCSSCLNTAIKEEKN